MSRFLQLSLIALFSCFSICLFGQGRSCNMENHLQELLENPDYRINHQEKMLRLQQMSENTIRPRMDCSNRIILPVAVHFQGVSNPDRSCLEAQAIDQIRIANEDFQGINADISEWANNASAFFSGANNGEGCLEFCLATTNHPPGFGLSDGDLAVTINQTNGSFSSAWSGYINIFVRNIGALGFSPLGGNGNGDGVTVDNNAFGSVGGCGGNNPNAPFNLGRTLTHEFGHYFSLPHIWGNGCGSDDGVADTPNQSTSRFGCPALGVSSCGSNDMHMNYMDYTNDACMYMFSAGQMSRMETYINNFLGNVINNGTNICEASEVITCSDNIQNGDEEGVDCGGSNCPPCVAEPTCDDNIQNGDEEGVDCGGSNCVPCLTPCLQDVSLALTLDSRGDQTTWDITNETGTVVASGGPYSFGNTGQTVTETVCLGEGCYTFTIYDVNGICCRQGNGSYTLTNDVTGVVIASGGSFRGSESSGFCIADDPVTPTCDDNIQNGDEEGVDCGGSNCPPCVAEPTCDDNIQNGDEEGVDCGGSNCPPCVAEPTCDDNIQNGDEEGVDCGGSNCPPCVAEPTCDDNIQNGDEEGVDCGGSNCPPCVAEPTCDDNIQNGDEEGVDCGGSNCPPCVVVACGVPSGLNVRILSTSVLISWQSVSNAAFYEVQYRVAGTTVWTTVTSFGRRVRVSGLDTDQIHEYRIRAICSGGTSDYSEINTFGGSARLAPASTELKVYPNPVTSMLNIAFNLEASGRTTVRLYDVLGHRVVDIEQHLSVGANRLDLDVSNLPSGYYLLQIQNGEQRMVQRLIKESL